MTEQHSGFRRIFKTTSIFGGTQVIVAVLSIITNKILAVLIGSTGMGINSLFLTATGLINTISGLGLHFSAIREISQSNESGDFNKLNRTIIIFRKWLRFCALLGAVISIVFSPLLSQITFGSKAYTLAFISLSIVVIFNTLNNGNAALLQGTKRIAAMAKTSIFGALIGLCAGLPVMYFYGINGIVPTLIIVSFFNFIIGYFFVRKIKIEKIKIPTKDAIHEGGTMAKLGVFFMISVLLGALVTYCLNIFLYHYGSLSDVGFYQAGMIITTQSIGLVFTAMSKDYYPRLSAINTDNSKVRNMANQQSEITILIAVPILMAMILFAPILIKILLSSEFIVITNFVRWIAFGMIFKAASYSLGYISFAKGDKKTFIILEGILGNVVVFILNIIGYVLGGINGLAVSFVCSYIIYFVVINIVTYKLYGFSYNKDFKNIFLKSVLLSFIIFLIMIIYPSFYGYLSAIFVFCISIYYFYYELNKRLLFKTLLIEMKNKYLK